MFLQTLCILTTTGLVYLYYNFQSAKVKGNVFLVLNTEHKFEKLSLLRSEYTNAEKVHRFFCFPFFIVDKVFT